MENNPQNSYKEDNTITKTLVKDYLDQTTSCFRISLSGITLTIIYGDPTDETKVDRIM